MSGIPKQAIEDPLLSGRSLSFRNVDLDNDTDAVDTVSEIDGSYPDLYFSIAGGKLTLDNMKISITHYTTRIYMPALTIMYNHINQIVMAEAIDTYD
jgi:hypothetical protein